MDTRTRLLDTLQRRIRSLMQPLYHEQSVFREETTRRLDAVFRETAVVEELLHDVAESVLFSRWMSDPNILASRKEAGHWLNWLGLMGEGVEVGVFKGEFSAHLLRTWQCERLTSVDPWREFPSTEYVDTCNAPQSQHELNYSETRERLQPFVNRSRILRMTSDEAVGEFADGSLDFVYLDAQHHYEAVRDDIRRWYPKVRSGGVIGGHDYLDGTRSSGVYGVKRAVGEFASSKGYDIVSTREPGWPSWFIRIG